MLESMNLNHQQLLTLFQVVVVAFNILLSIKGGVDLSPPTKIQ